MRKVCLMMLVMVMGLSLTGYGTVIPMYNPGFEQYVLPGSYAPATTANCPWYVVAGGGSYLYKTEGMGGSQSFSLAPNSQSNNNYLYATLYSLPTYANVGDTITLSFYSDAWRGYPTYLLSTDLTVYFYNAESPYQAMKPAETIAIAGAGYGWQQYSSSFILPAGITTVSAAFYFAPTDPMTYSIYFDNFSASAVPEPATLGLLSLGLIGLLRGRRT